MRSAVAWAAAVFLAVVLCASPVYADCLADIQSYVGEYELPAYTIQLPDVAKRIQSIDWADSTLTNGAALDQYAIAAASLWPRELDYRMTCTRNAKWIFYEMFSSYAAVKNLPLKATAPGKWKHTGPHNSVKIQVLPKGVSKANGYSPFPLAVTNWEQDTIWNANGKAFQNGEKRAVLIHIEHSKHDHYFVLEAPDHGQLHLYQAFVNCYSLKDWMRAPNKNKPFHTEEALYPLSPESECKPDSAHAAYGGGQLLKDSAAQELILDIQDIIDAVHQNADGPSQWTAKPNNRKTMSDAVAAFTGATLTTPRLGDGSFKIGLEYVQTSDDICAYNKNEVIDPVLSEFRKSLAQAVVVNTNTKLIPFTQFSPSWVISHPSIKTLDAAYYDVRSRRNWKSQIYRTKRTEYWRLVQDAASHFCSTNDEYDYRFVVSNQKTETQQLIETLSTKSELTAWLLPSPNTAGFKSVVYLDLSCTEDSANTALGMSCKTFAVRDLKRVNDKAVALKLIPEARSRYEFQFCLDKNTGAVTKAQSIPYYTLK